ncbi:hypothetical protein HUG15_14280 [Salicibibacter cibarius]|uniref:Uncharacterized protein n=1 Tax=Salicibibacter cibarius TaxID=2743000 RepID=A0A7T6Z4K2_9BACI|nr:hypothetical protein HUG15_14280 [Salicibibacter cibarius]
MPDNAGIRSPEKFAVPVLIRDKRHGDRAAVLYAFSVVMKPPGDRTQGISSFSGAMKRS